MSSQPPSNPFQAPSARVADQTTGAAGSLLTEPRAMPAAVATQWFGTAWEKFKDAPGPWVGMFVTMSLCILVLSIVPLLGMLVSVIMPVFTAGLMLAAEGQEQGVRPAVGQVFDGFRRNAGNLALVGVLYLALTIGVGLLMGVGLVGLLFTTTAVGADSGIAAGAVGVGIVVLLIATAIFVPLSFAISWAPALVAIHDVAPLDAIKSAFLATLRNWLPLLVLSLLVLLAMIPVLLTLGLGFFVLGPVMFLVLWAAYRDIFVQ